MEASILASGVLGALPSTLVHIQELFGNLPDVNREQSEALKVVLLAAALLLVALWRALPRRAALVSLGLLAAVSTVNYARWGDDVILKKVDVYDLTHYYINARYFDELGYYDLYPAAIYADFSNGGPHFRKQGNRYMAQNEAGHGIKTIDHALERGEKVKSERFTPETWAAFEHDVLYLQREIPGFTDSLWREMIQDHGYNGTPAWTSLAKPLALITPVEHVKLLGYIDLLLILGACAATGWAFSPATAAWLWFFFMTCYSARWPTITWSYLRYDYICALLIGMALLKKGRHFAAGVMTGWAACMRFFPAMWLYGPGMKGIFGLFRGVVHRRLLALAGGFLVGVTALQAIALVDHGVESSKVHFENMMDHNSSEQLSSRRIGLALALPYRGELEPKLITKERKAEIEAQKPLRFALAGLTMLLLGWGLRNAKDEETYAFGFIPFFLLTTASYYYYIARATLAVMHAADLSKTRNQVGLGVLLGLELFTNWAETAWPGHRVFLIGGLSWGIAGYTALMTIWFLAESHAKAREGGEAALAAK